MSPVERGVWVLEMLSRKVKALSASVSRGLFNSLGSLQYILPAFIDFWVFRASQWAYK
jgi:hypothetical protein